MILPDWTPAGALPLDPGKGNEGTAKIKTDRDKRGKRMSNKGVERRGGREGKGNRRRRKGRVRIWPIGEILHAQLRILPLLDMEKKYSNKFYCLIWLSGIKISLISCRSKDFKIPNNNSTFWFLSVLACYSTPKVTLIIIISRVKYSPLSLLKLPIIVA